MSRFNNDSIKNVSRALRCTSTLARLARKIKKPKLHRALTLLLLPSNASSSAKDERWLVHKSYSQMLSERDGGVARDERERERETERLRRRR